MKLRLLVMLTVAFFTVAAVAYADNDGFNQVTPKDYDPGHTFLVEATWLDGIGCPTNAPVEIYPATSPNSTFTDSGCPTGDSHDNFNEGLLLSKEGPTSNNAAALAQLTDVPRTLTELGYDIRKPGADVNDPRGSHCGAGAPRFDNTAQDGSTYFLGCDSPPPTVDTAATSPNGWQRLRWGGTSPLMAYDSGYVLTSLAGVNVKSIQIVFDESYDTGPDNFGLAVLDNIDVNGTLVGHGPNTHHDEEQGGRPDNGDSHGH